MQCTQGEIHSQEEENHMEEEGNTEKEVVETQLIEGELKWVQGETQMQWTWIEKEEEIGRAMCMENGAIWPKIAGKDIGEG